MPTGPEIEDHSSERTITDIPTVTQALACPGVDKTTGDVLIIPHCSEDTLKCIYLLIVQPNGISTNRKYISMPN